MIAVDTNVLVRYIVKDDPEQTARAIAVFRSASVSNRIYISSVVLVETIWVLKSRYHLDDNVLTEVFNFLFKAPQIRFQDEEALGELLKTGFTKTYMDDFAVAVSCAANCSAFLTFDVKLVKRHTTAQLP